MDGFTRSCGRALVAGGALMILINVGITPLLPRSLGSAAVMSSGLFLLRQTASGVAALLLLAGSLGVHLAQRKAAGGFGAVAFGITFVGCALLVAVEWANVFVMHTIARISADTLAAVDRDTLTTVGFAGTAAVFATGWLLLSISAWRTAVLPRWAALATIAGLVVTPMLQAAFHLPGAIAGNVVLGAGFVGLGAAVSRADTES